MNYPLAITIVGVAFCAAQVIKTFLKICERNIEERRKEKKE